MRCTISASLISSHLSVPLYCISRCKQESSIPCLFLRQVTDEEKKEKQQLYDKSWLSLIDLQANYVDAENQKRNPYVDCRSSYLIYISMPRDYFYWTTKKKREAPVEEDWFTPTSTHVTNFSFVFADLNPLN